MDVTQLTVDPEVAEQKLNEYRDALKKPHDETDERIMQAYKALSQGTPILELEATMRAAGTDEMGLPKLAIGRANWERCFYFSDEIEIHFGDTRESATCHWRHVGDLHRVELPQVFPNAIHTRDRNAIVPRIPPSLRPRHALQGYFILWEAVWTEDAPIDPFLLKRIGPRGSTLYAILAEWDLTDVERIVLQQQMAGR